MSGERKYELQPAGPLMKEHRLIEKMVGLLDDQINKIKGKTKVDFNFLKATVDFFQFYADHCHHGKEEDILFRRLEKKEMAKEHQEIMEGLLADHRRGRQLVKQVDQLAANLGQEGAAGRIVQVFEEIVNLYRQHIQKEDKQFFLPVMKYFEDKEKDEMINQFFDFDKELIHEKYRKIVEEIKNK